MGSSVLAERTRPPRETDEYPPVCDWSPDYVLCERQNNGRQNYRHNPPDEAAHKKDKTLAPGNVRRSDDRRTVSMTELHHRLAPDIRPTVLEGAPTAWPTTDL